MTHESNYRRAVGKLIAGSALTATLLFGTAGTVRWWNGWAFLSAFVVVMTAVTVGLFGRSPELLEERRSAAKKARGWDRLLVPLLSGVLPTVGLVLAGLDRRWGWTAELPLLASLGALLMMLAGSGLTFWAMKSNPFFSSHVRIQADRGQTVVRAGPYRFVRHPGYGGSILYNLAVPVLLGSYASLAVGLLFVLATALRAALEDHTLRQELDGYRAYCGQVRRRLVPLLW